MDRGSLEQERGFVNVTCQQVLHPVNDSYISIQPKLTPLMDALKTWERIYFTEPAGNPILFYCVHGDFEVDFAIDFVKYRTAGIPEALEVSGFGPTVHPEYVKSFLNGYLWQMVAQNDPVLASQIMQSKECYVIRAELNDAPNLNYLRDVVGLIAYLLDHGGVSVFDPLSFLFIRKSDWMEKIFQPNEPVPGSHVMLLCSEETHGLKWYHTRGMRKFGRPDLSIHGVSAKYEQEVYELLSRFIGYQALGGIIQHNQLIKMNGLPPGMYCEPRGDYDDPDFNNKHVEIHWPAFSRQDD